MSKQHDRPVVGAPDPELRNSPIFDEPSDELLHCEERGVWVREGTCQ